MSGMLLVFGALTIKKIYDRAHLPPPDIVRSLSHDSLVLQNGQHLDTAKLQGRVVVVLSWASWCPSCSVKLQTLSELKKIYGERLEVLAVNRGEEKSTMNDYRAFAHLPENISYVEDPSDIYFKQVDGRSMPELIIFSKDGKIQSHLFDVPSLDELKSIIDRVL